MSGLRLEMFKAIQDPVWGYLEIPEQFIKIIDTKDFQRLHWIRQLGLCYLVYPGAVHTRFQHSLGTMHLASLFGEKLNTEHKTELALSALLHDIGHFPFSHSFEDYFKQTMNKDHESVGIDIIMGKTEDQAVALEIEKIGVDPSVLVHILKGDKPEFSIESSIVSGSLDADEMDYLVRDSYFTGAGNLSLSIKRLIDIIRSDGDELYIEEKGVTSVESILISRLLMHKSVYFHKTAKIAQKMIERSLWRFSGAPDSIYRTTDGLLLEKLKNFNNCKETIDDIENRRLLKIIFKTDKVKMNENEISEILRKQFPDLIVDFIPPLSFLDRKKTKDEVLVKIGNDLVNISDVSPLLNSLYESFNRRTLYVYGESKYLDSQEKLKKLLIN